jgi:hypothetical protein
MNLLTPQQIKAWYNASLSHSGFQNLQPSFCQIWSRLATHGKPSLPPGFLAGLIEGLTHRDAGDKTGNAADPLEARLFECIRAIPGFEYLEGMFILGGPSQTDEFLSEVLFQFLDRLPGFFVPIHFVPQDVVTAFQPATLADTGFSARPILEEIYREVLGNLQRSRLELSQTDLFEITRPGLFRKPADRTFYRSMMQAVRGIRRWITGVFTLKEETPTIVTQFGEPQVLPLGGYDALTNRGDISSLVPSELAYIDDHLDFDLFDYKYSTNQLMYFKREEGAVFRIRRNIFVQLNLTSLLEHERFLGLFFGWCLLLSEKILATFVKDIVNLSFCFHGFKPSSLDEAGDFFRHFLEERALAERITFAYAATAPETPAVADKTQAWLLSRVAVKGYKHITLVFPQDEEFAHLPEGEQERFLGELATQTVFRMVNHADR